MSLQRRKGDWVKVWPETEVTDRRGNRQLMVNTDDEPTMARAVMIPQRSTKGEVPGQVQVIVYRMIVSHTLDVGLWSRVEWNGQQFDVAAPPTLHTGTKLTRHWSLDLRQRPPDEQSDVAPEV